MDYTPKMVKRLLLDYSDIREKCMSRGPSYSTMRVTDGHYQTREDTICMLADVESAVRACLSDRQQGVFDAIQTMYSPHRAWTQLEWIAAGWGITPKALDMVLTRMAKKICSYLEDGVGK